MTDEQAAAPFREVATTLRERELAERWKTSPRTLQRWRAENFGPAWIRIGGAIRYLMKDVVDYENRHRIRGER